MVGEYRPIKPAASPVSYCINYPSPHQRCNHPIPATDLYCSACKATRAKPRINPSGPVSLGGEKGTAFLSTPKELRARVVAQPGWLYDLLGPEISEAFIAAAYRERGLQKDIYYDVPVELPADGLGVEGDVVAGSVAEGGGSESVGAE